jgi:sulfatase modifying factor 1
MALVGHTCVDKWESSLVEIQPGGSEAAFSAHEVPNGHEVRAVSRPGVAPQAHISMIEAQRACKASGKRLCHAKEWKAACRGPANTTYPYGVSHVDDACVDTHRISPMAVLHHGEHTGRTMNDPMANQLANTVEPTGDASQCTNAYGVYDMVGNVHEWTDDGHFRGGYYLDTKLNGPGCEYVTTAHAKSYYDYSTGFRCCADEGTLSDDSQGE